MRDLIVAIVGLALVDGTALAASNGAAERSLDRCQSTVAAQSLRYMRVLHSAIDGCLRKVSTEVVRRNGPLGSSAVDLCTPRFTRIGRNDGKSLGDKFMTRVAATCDPAKGAAHSLADLLGGGAAGVAHPLGVRDLGALCAGLGGDGMIDSATEWIACVRAAQECSVNYAIASEFPRALEWLASLAAQMPTSPARDAVLATEVALDGPSDDGIADTQCPPAPTPTPIVTPPTPTPSPTGCPTEIIGDEYDGNCDGFEDCFSDSDGDGVSSIGGIVRSSDADCQDPGEASQRDPMGDCCDVDPAVKPGQSAFFTTARLECGGFDYDCNRTDAPQFGLVPPASSACSAAPPPCVATNVGFQAPLPACGASGTFQDCDLTTCATVTTSRVQACR